MSDSVERAIAVAPVLHGKTVGVLAAYAAGPVRDLIDATRALVTTRELPEPAQWHAVRDALDAIDTWEP